MMSRTKVDEQAMRDLEISVIHALAEWTLHMAKKKTEATPEELTALPEVATALLDSIPRHYC